MGEIKLLKTSSIFTRAEIKKLLALARKIELTPDATADFKHHRSTAKFSAS
jgi:hypothetical protein